MILRSLLTLLFVAPIVSFAQNMQLADLYLTYNSYSAIIPLDTKTDLIATSWSEDDKFYPDHQDFNTYVDNTKDAYVVWQEAQNHDYVKHIRFAGDSIQQIERMWVSADEDIFIVLSSSAADTISITGEGNSALIQQPEQGNIGLCYFLVKLNKTGEYQNHLFLGYYNSNQLSFLYPVHIDNTIPVIMYSADSTNYIPGTTKKLIGSKFANRTASFKIACSDLKISEIKTNAYEYFYGKTLSSFDVEINYIKSFKGQPVPDSASCMIRYNGEINNLKDSLICSKNTDVMCAVSIADTLYLVLQTIDSMGYSVGQYKFDQNIMYLTKWVNGVLVDSSSAYLNDANLFLDKSKQLYFYGHVVSPDYKPVNINFLNGNPYILKDDQVFRFWGPIVNDSLKWLSHIAGNVGTGVGPFYFYADSNAQYFQSTLKSWMDLDPGRYEWQFNPLTYDGKSVIAKYNCFPNAIFTLDQTAQKVQFYNFSSGGVTYKWLFGVGSASSTDLNPLFKYPAIGDYDVTLIAYNDCGSDTFTFPVSIDKMISVDEMQVTYASIYPNPTIDKLYINHDFNNGSISIYDLNGKKIWSDKLKNSRDAIDVSKIKPGMYLAVIKDEMNAVTRKIVIH
ncbi:MAG: hypothetical protein ACI9JN_000099 [Bacteroidia bacterium]|jgi:hypothetical protein